jgi:hypothetical protein
MSLSHSALLLSVAFTLCVLLPTTFGGIAKSRSKVKIDKDSEIIELLEKLRMKLTDGKEKKEFQAFHDTFNEERSRNFDVEISSSKAKKIHLNARADSALTDDQKTQLVDAMNDKRRAVDAADMYKLHWNDNLAKLAQTWADQCIFKHGHVPFEASELGFTEVGANLVAYTGDFDADKIVQDWFKDQEHFDRKTQSCEYNQPCGNYKQLVHAKSTDTGCGIASCPSMSELPGANFVVCYFAPPGNYHGEHTFHGGPACSKCSHGQFYCDNGLCDHTCTSEGPNCECTAAWQNCGTQTDDCKCSCKPGSVGVDCGRDCADGAKCGKPVQGGWSKKFCSPAFPFVLDLCPVMCGVCDPDAKPCGRDDER